MLGCNQSFRKDCANYFLLVASDYPEHKRYPGDCDSSPSLTPTISPSASSCSSSSWATEASLSPSLRSPIPVELPLGINPEEIDGASVSDWVLDPKAVAGGQESLAQTLRELLKERRKNRVMAGPQLIKGNGSTSSCIDVLYCQLTSGWLPLTIALSLMEAGGKIL